MKYNTPYPIKAVLQGGEHDGKVIELPAAFRGVDIEPKAGGRVARYRYGGRGEVKDHVYTFRSQRRGYSPGAKLDVSDDLKASGLNFYP